MTKIPSQIVRVDLAEDAGISLSPEVDIGQIEGAFVMGLGLWTTEKLDYDKSTGHLHTNHTWVRHYAFLSSVSFVIGGFLWIWNIHSR